jgi:hypothetical protein
LLSLPLARRLLLILLLFALWRLRDDKGRMERRGVNNAYHDGGEDCPRQNPTFCVRHQTPIPVSAPKLKKHEVN